MVSICPNCEKPLLVLSGIIDPKECPYCGHRLDEKENTENIPEEETPLSDIDRDIVEIIHRTQSITCHYCKHDNPFSNNYCQKCGSNLAWASIEDEEDVDKKLANQLTSEMREKCMIEGIMAFMKTLMKREGNENGKLLCQKCNTKYPFDTFFCPNCGSETWLTEMREVLQGSVKNRELVEEFQRSFPNFKIIGYANSASFRSGMTNSMKIELDNMARGVMKILETSAVFLKANTQDIKKSTIKSDDSDDETNLFNLLGGDFGSEEPDERVLDFLGSTTINIEENDSSPEPELEISSGNAEIEEPISDDWFDQ